jgi:3-oxoadipate enol-lactonase / 4-carboxymuconolactone decarboxylase
MTPALTTAPAVTTIELTTSRRAPLLVVGPSLGTSVEALWAGCAALLADRFHVVGWDLPGHGTNHAPVPCKVTIADLAGAVSAAVNVVVRDRGQPDAPVGYAGVSVGAAVGLQLMLDQPARVRRAVLACTGARIGTAQLWRQRAAAVLDGGTAALLDGSVQRWFAPGFAARRPEIVAALTGSLKATEPAGYAAVCGALELFDLTGRLGEVEVPILAIAGGHDLPTPPAVVRQLARGVQRGRLAVLPYVAHLAPAEAPGDVARLIINHMTAGIDK